MATSEDEDTETPSEDVQEVAYYTQDAETNCTICYAEFLDSEDLDQHIKQVHRGRSICQFCDTTYTGLDAYARHITDVHWKKLKSCRYCTKIFTNMSNLVSHEKRHVRKKAYACSQCTVLLTNCKEVEIHEKIYHDNSVDGVLLKCMVHLTEYLKLYAPAALQDSKQALECIVCGFTTFLLQPYIEHLNTDKCLAHVCDRCGHITKKKNSLIKHYKRKKKCHDVKSYMNFEVCPHCLNRYPRIVIEEHKKSCKIIFKCQSCECVFQSIDELSNHQAQEHPVELDIITCKFCRKEFVSEHILKKHLEKAHKPKFHEYKYECKMCVETYFKHPKNLFGHFFSKHKDFEPYTCEICNKKFRIRKNFTIHIKLEHKSIGFVEFDDQYNVFFRDKKSDNPFIPKCVIPNFNPEEYNRSKNMDTDFLETETENEGKQVMKTKKLKKKMSHVKDIVTLSSSDDEDAEPLHSVKKRIQQKKFNKQHFKVPKHMKSKMMKRKSLELTCRVCNKYCYTYQHYHNHLKMHSKYQDIDCIKCSRTFSSKKDLNEHMSSEHSTSRLIETLKTVLGRKQGDTGTKTDDTSNISHNKVTKKPYESNSSERFAKTIKKVKIDKAVAPAIITSSDNISAKKFIENFVPEITEGKEPKETTVLTRYNSPYYRPQTIKLHKFVPEKPPTNIKLKMPERFKGENKRVEVKVKIVQKAIKPSTFEINTRKFDDYGDHFQDDDNYYDKYDSIPEVALEVMLEGTEEPPKKLQAPQRIVIPKLPDGYPNNIHIATLAPQAPFYKIIKVKGAKDEPIIIDTTEQKEEVEPRTGDNEEFEDFIRLKDGTKLVRANPLAHLLGDKPVEELLQPIKNKHYKPAIPNVKVKGLLAEALQKLDEPNVKRQRKKPTKEKVQKAP